MPSSNIRKNIKSALLALCVIALWGPLTGCELLVHNNTSDPNEPYLANLLNLPDSPNAKKHPMRRVAMARPLAGSASATSWQLAPFFGNLTVVTELATDPVNNYNILWRQANCTITFANYSITGNSQNQIQIAPTQYLPDYGKTLHNAAYLTTTPDTFSKGCVDTTAGVQSSIFVMAGQDASGSEMLAITGSNSLITGTVNGYQNFTGPTNLTTNYPPTGVVAGDLNKDGIPDVVSLNTDGLNASVTVFLGKSDGTYQPGVNLALPGNAVNYAVIDDMDGDGNLDIVAVSTTSTATFSVFLGKGDGTFQPIQNVLIPGALLSFSNAIVSTDVNHDGHKDIVATSGEVFLGKGDGITYTLVPQTAFANMQSGSSIVAADFNNDGKIDLVTDDQRLFRTYKGNGDGTFTAGPTYPTIGDLGYIHATDLDGDGNLDIWSGFAGDVIYVGSGISTGYALMGNGDGTFQGAPNLPFSYNGSNLMDLNGDGRPDFVGVLPTGSSTTIATYLTSATGVPTPGPTLVVSGNPGVDSLALGDVTGDKIPDVVFLSPVPQQQSFYVAIGKGDGSFQAPTTTPIPSLVPAGGIDVNEEITGVRLADMDHDGKLDLVYSFYDQDSQGGQLYYEGFAVQLGNGDGTFKAPQIVYTYQGATKPLIAPGNLLNAIFDVNGDNFPDVFMVVPNGIAEGTAQAIVEDFIGKGDGTFKAPNTLTVTPNVVSANPSSGFGSPFAFADLDGDGKIDMVVSGTSVDGTQSQLAICLGNGDGTFKSPTITLFSGFGPLSSPALADFDGDGKIDLALSSGILPGNGDGTFQTLTNTDGTADAPFTLYLQSLGSAVATDLNGDGKPDFVSGTTIFLSKFGALPPVLATTTTTVTSSLNPSTVGANVTFTATVISATAGTITGTVTFFDGATQLGAGTLNGSGMATFSTAALTQATHSITAQYGGDANYSGSNSTAVSQVVNASGGTAATTTMLTSSLNPSTVGAGVTFTGTVTSTTQGTISGSISFYDGAKLLDTPITMTGNIATLNVSNLSQGTHTITAVYSGNSSYASSTSAPVSQVVNGSGTAATTTMLTSSLNPSTVGAGVTFTAQVTSTTPGTISGSVTFFDGATQLGTPITMTGNLATYTATKLAQGTHSITAHYNGNTNFAASTSTPVSQVVNAGATLPSTTALSASTTNAVSGTNITFTATVTESATAAKRVQAAQTAPAVTGTVTFFDGSTQLGTGTVGTGGAATYQNSTLAVGSHSITAQYGGDSNYAASTSPAVQVTITATAGSFTLSANPSSVTVTKSQGGTSTISVTPAGGFSQAVTLACSGLPSGFSCTFGPPTVTPDGAPATSTLTITEGLAPGGARHPISALLPADGANSRGGRSGGGIMSPRGYGFALAFAGQLAMLGLLFVRRKRVLGYAAGRITFALLTCGLAVTFMAGCSSGGGTQMVSVTVTGTAGTQSATTTIAATLPNN